MYGSFNYTRESIPTYLITIHLQLCIVIAKQWSQKLFSINSELLCDHSHSALLNEIVFSAPPPSKSSGSAAEWTGVVFDGQLIVWIAEMQTLLATTTPETTHWNSLANIRFWFGSTSGQSCIYLVEHIGDPNQHHRFRGTNDKLFWGLQQGYIDIWRGSSMACVKWVFPVNTWLPIDESKWCIKYGNVFLKTK